jgi:hypothetical protein
VRLAVDDQGAAEYDLPMKPEVDNPGKLTARLLARVRLSRRKLVEEIVAESAPLDPAEVAAARQLVRGS